ncbi:MAG: polysaccharide deacetylase family protein [Ruminococcus sp.]|nr:polysaccharide deacetylase family protein [Ruminococcus sp.]
MLKKRVKYFLINSLIFIIALCLITFFQIERTPVNAVSESELNLPIIMYHSLLKDSKMQNDFTISPELFENDLKYLQSENYTTIVVEDLIDYVYRGKELPDKCIMLTFDDGYYNNYYYAYPLLKKYNSKAVISPIISMTEKFTETEDISPSYGHISVSDIKEMVESGYVEIQNHSYDLHKLSPRKGADKRYGESNEAYRKSITEDIMHAQNYLTENVGITPKCFVYPFGAKGKETPQIIKDMGFLCTMTCTEEMNYISKDTESLYELGRYRRDLNESMEHLMNRINSDIK